MHIRHFRHYLVAVALLAAPAPLLGQDRPAPPDHPHPRMMIGKAMQERGPVAMLLRQRDSLRLSTEQVTRLEDVQRRLIERNRPLIEQLLQLRQSSGEPPRVRPQEMTPQQREEWQRRVEQARPIMQQIRDNNRQAMEEVRSILTPEQRQQVRERIEARRREKRERGGPHGGRWQRGERRDTARGRPN